jgi:rRNA maturation endonuclease Nob1
MGDFYVRKVDASTFADLRERCAYCKSEAPKQQIFKTRFCERCGSGQFETYLPDNPAKHKTQ